MQGETVPLSNSLPPFQILYDLISARKAHAKIRTVLQSTLFTGYNLQFPTLSKLRKYEFVHQGFVLLGGKPRLAITFSLGPSIAVCLREVSAYERLKTRTHHRGKYGGSIGGCGSQTF